MDAARDHGFENGLVIPFHYVDPLGRMCWSVCTFFWRDKLKEFLAGLPQEAPLPPHRAALLGAAGGRHRLARAPPAGALPRRRRQSADPGRRSSIREKDVLSWAARGKTGAETAEILGVSKDTVETHTRHAIQKLGAINKTHAVVTAVHLRAIEI